MNVASSALTRDEDGIHREMSRMGGNATQAKSLTLALTVHQQLYEALRNLNTNVAEAVEHIVQSTTRENSKKRYKTISISTESPTKCYYTSGQTVLHYYHDSLKASRRCYYYRMHMP